MKQEQMQRIAQLIEDTYNPKEPLMTSEVAEYLVNNGIGNSDRFEIWDRKYGKPIDLHYQGLDIKPKQFKEEV